jgi:hypothetical protein
VTLLRHLQFAWLTTAALIGVPAFKPDFALLRPDEDYSPLAHTRRTGWSRIKFVPLTSDQTSWLSFGGEARVRYEYYRNENWSDVLNDNDGYLLTRTYAHADVQAGRFRFFGQLQSSFSEGRRGGPGPIDVDRVDVQQAFAAWTSAPRSGAQHTEVRLGRQEVQFGSGRLVAARAGANTRQAFDGGLVRTQATDRRLDLFWLASVRTNRLEFDNKRESGRYLAGAYATFGKLHGGANVDVYVLASREPNRAYVGVISRERRWSVALRPWGRLGPWDYNFEFVGQFGSFADESIRAWTAASDTGFTWTSAPATPRLGLKANIASGDRQLGDGKRGTFNALYPKAAYFGEISQVGPANFINVHPSLTVQPSERVTLTVDAVFFWREQLEDGVYGPSLRLERDPGASRARHVGNQFDFILSWQISPFVTFDMSTAVFTAGRFLRETGPAKTVRYFYSALTYQF